MTVVRRVIELATACLAIGFASPASAQQPAPQPTTPAPPGQFQPQATSPQPSPWGTMGSGGVTPPPPLQPTTPQNQPPPNNDYSHALDHSKDKDSGRGLSWFWVDAYGGFEQAALQAFNNSSTTFSAGQLIKTSGSGGVIGGGLGAQILFFTIGLRGRMGFFQPWQVGRIGPEVGFRFPLGILEPHFDFGGGYAALANFDPVVPKQVGIHGGYGRVNAGLDVFPIKFLSLGGEASFDFLGLTRSALSATDVAAVATSNPGVTAAQRALLAEKGTGLGATFAIVGIIGVHL